MARTYRPATLPATRPALQLSVGAGHFAFAASARILQLNLPRRSHGPRTLRSAPAAEHEPFRSNGKPLARALEQNSNITVGRAMCRRDAGRPMLGVHSYLSSHQSSRRLAL